MVLNIKELNLDKDRKYVMFLEGKVSDADAIEVMRVVRTEFERIGIDNNNIFYFPYPAIIFEK